MCFSPKKIIKKEKKRQTTSKVQENFKKKKGGVGWGGGGGGGLDKTHVCCTWAILSFTPQIFSLLIFLLILG